MKLLPTLVTALAAISISAAATPTIAAPAKGLAPRQTVPQDPAPQHTEIAPPKTPQRKHEKFIAGDRGFRCSYHADGRFLLKFTFGDSTVATDLQERLDDIVPDVCVSSEEDNYSQRLPAKACIERVKVGKLNDHCRKHGLCRMKVVGQLNVHGLKNMKHCLMQIVKAAGYPGYCRWGDVPG